MVSSVSLAIWNVFLTIGFLVLLVDFHALSKKAKEFEQENNQLQEASMHSNLPQMNSSFTS